MFAKIDLFVSFMTNIQSFKFNVLKNVIRTFKTTIDTKFEKTKNNKIIDVNNNINNNNNFFLINQIMHENNA